MLRCLEKTKHSKDSGWCWVMLFCTSVLMFLVFGVHYTYGILYPSLLKEFSQGEGKTAWIGSLASGLLFLSSFLAIKSCELTSVTTTCLIGSLLSGVGLILTSVITDFHWLYFVYGTLFGVGSSFLYTPGFIMILKWFDKYQLIATGVASASAALGAVVIGPLVEYTIRKNGMRQTVKVAGILYLSVSLLCALSYKPLDENREKESKISISDDEELLTTYDGKKKKKKKTFHLNMTLFKNKAYLVYLLAMMLTNFTYYIPMIHLVNYAKHLNIDTGAASFLISIWSIANICGRITFGKLATHHRRHTLRIYQIAMFCSGVVTILTYFATSYWMLVCYVVTYGFLDGSFIGLLSIVTLDIVGLDDMAQGFGIMLTSIGFPIALGPPFVGMINDMNLLNPNSMFLISGIPFVIGSFLMAIVIKIKNNERESVLLDDDLDVTEHKELISYETSV